ncbi:MAG TPA: FkbM family methyltransferase [Candidatus Brocadiia bacterium]|nr:FkbM family methyltransferase [Candidatus Brocadiales bacterium]
MGIKKYSRFRILIQSFIAWSPFLVTIFNETLRIRRWRSLQSVLRLFGSTLPNPIDVEGHILFHHSDDINTTIGLGVGDYEPEVRKTVTQFLSPGTTMIDAGANIGYYTLLAARAVGPQGHVYAFEPAPSTVELLRKNVDVNGYSGRVTVVPKAITNKSSKVRIFLDYVHSGTSSMFSDGLAKDAVEVEGVSLDEFFSSKGWPPINIIKMDIEGAEKLALEGMRELVRRNQGLKLIIEVNLSFSVEELFEALQGCRFSRFHLLEDRNRVVDIPKDIPHIISTARGVLVNLLCEKAN